MKRRTFVKTASSLAIAVPFLPIIGHTRKMGQEDFLLKETLTLKGFDNEQEERPVIVSGGTNEFWMFSLRRLSHPENSEMISAFHFNGGIWKEINPVTEFPGEYETPFASCATNGKPVVAWTEIKDEDWSIKATLLNKDGFGNTYKFPVKPGRSINPVLISPDKNRNWIAWENFSNGKFTIYISKYANNKWSEPIRIDKGENSCFDPCMVESIDGDLYVAYGLTDGFHQNIEMAIIDGKSLDIKETVPIAIGGGHKNRVNINAKPALAFDAQDNLWISYENNHNSGRLEDGDNYTGDRCCAILSYQDGKIVEVADQGKWLFNSKNDHKPSFFKDFNGQLFLATHCGGNFSDSKWQYRISWLDPSKGWQQPVTLLKTGVKGLLIPPTMAFDKKGDLWFATSIEQTFRDYEPVSDEDIKTSRLAELKVMRFSAPVFTTLYNSIKFKETEVEQFRADMESIGPLSGHPKAERRQMTKEGQTYTLLYGNLHEHSNSSNCWPAGTDGTLHEDYRFGMFSEGYDFFGMTDHAMTTNELQWRRNMRLADFYNQSEKFVAIPAIEWTLSSDPNLEEIQHGAGHYNIIFESTEDAKKYIRNKHELFSPHTPEANIAPTLWKLLDEKEINCVTIPHHPADDMHPVDWDVTNNKYVTAVEIFQCRGNHEYSGCPREINLKRHSTTPYKRAFVDYALKTKKYKLGFTASGDHNSMGVGLAGLWVKEVSRKGILEALRSRRTFATTGDKMFIHLTVNEVIMGSTSTHNKIPELNIEVIGQYPLSKVEILRNSSVIHQYSLEKNEIEFVNKFKDVNYKNEKEVLYYYIRATQKNNAIAWSSPVWVEMN